MKWNEPHDPLARPDVSSMEGMIPPGVVVDLDSTESTGFRIVTVFAVCLSVATIVLVMRLYSKFVILRRPGWDDSDTCIIGWFFSTLFGIGAVKQVEWGLGKHTWDISELDMSYLRFWGWFVNVYFGAIIFTKMSILLLYLRVFEYKSWFRYSVYALMILNFTGSMLGLFGNWFSCRDPRGFWKPYSVPTKCLSPPGGNWPNFSATSINIFTDLIMLVLPVPIVARLQLPLKQRLGVIALFAIAVIATLFSILRMVSFLKFPEHVDWSWDWETQAFLGYPILEVNLYIICGSLPILRPVLAPIFPILFSAGNRHSISRTRAERSYDTGLKRWVGHIPWLGRDQDSAGSFPTTESDRAYMPKYNAPPSAEPYGYSATVFAPTRRAEMSDANV
ncbi:MAG: hypothetical protein M1833_003957 [Piccolia ochrophora]|nr:MAG: hypothetical protein M1833_003957 [Piccolia ochrophora]